MYLAVKSATAAPPKNAAANFPLILGGGGGETPPLAPVAGNATTVAVGKKGGLIDKISDTSLFAELVKDKHKRKRALAALAARNEKEALEAAPPPPDLGIHVGIGELAILGGKNEGENVDDIPMPALKNGGGHEIGEFLFSPFYLCFFGAFLALF